jgi:hypothetical protein
LCGAEPISQGTLEIARELIAGLIPSQSKKLPDAAPSADGSIGFEWWNGNSHLFIDVGPGKAVFAYLNLGGEQPIEEHFVWGEPNLLKALAMLFRRLYAVDAALVVL